jgi:molybdopterin/thiamine biosynthesis adenylyltransferase
VTAGRPAGTGRYARHTLIPDWSQPTLSAASVIIIGVGAVGSEAARLLGQAGVGRLLLCDPDLVEESNLSRGALYGAGDVGQHKATSAPESPTSVVASGWLSCVRPAWCSAAWTASPTGSR